MSAISIILEVANPVNPAAAEQVELLVDSGMRCSVVPAIILERLGIKSFTKQEFILASGEKIVRKKGAAFFKYGERIGGADIIFGEPGDATILGEYTLTALGLFLDPLRRELKSLPMILACASM
jgi:predicted aspartyl protease